MEGTVPSLKPNLKPKKKKKEDAPTEPVAEAPVEPEKPKSRITK